MKKDLLTFSYFRLPLRLTNLEEKVEAMEGSEGSDITSEQISDATVVGKTLITATSQATARTAIGAGISNIAIGTTASTAKAGNYVPTWTEITSKPTTFAPIIGTTATTAKAGNYTPTASEVLSAIEAMDSTQKTAVKTALGIV